MSLSITEAVVEGLGDSPVPALPPYSHELDWPEHLAPFKVVDDGTQGDPYAHYEWMRENAPVLRAASTTSVDGATGRNHRSSS